MNLVIYIYIYIYIYNIYRLKDIFEDTRNMGKSIRIRIKLLNLNKDSKKFKTNQINIQRKIFQRQCVLTKTYI